jgi:hypothetical protein
LFLGSNCQFTPARGKSILNENVHIDNHFLHLCRLLEPCELQLAFQEIIDTAKEPAPGEEKLAALTAGERVHWAVSRRKYFRFVL